MVVMAFGAGPGFASLVGIYEPSAVQQLPDGRFLVVEDEKEHPFSLVTIGPEGGIASEPLAPGLLDFNDAFWKLNDLEGLAFDRAGWVYAITSHSRSDDGEEKPSREKLVRFRVEGDRVRDPAVATGLKAALAAVHPALATAARLRDVKGDGGLNIEALEITPDQQRLLIGFRSPVPGGHALIATVANPAAMFDAGAEPQVLEPLLTLDLGGHGLRALSFLPSLDAYLLVSGPATREPAQFQLWFWLGPGHPPQRCRVPGLAGLEHAEGICPARLGGLDRILIVSDDGSRRAGRYARYLVLDPELLNRAMLAPQQRQS